MPEQLTTEQITFIKDNTKLDIKEVVAQLPNVDQKEVEILYNHYKKTSNNLHTPKVLDKDAFTAGNLMAQRDGVTVMTQASSELSDARKPKRTEINEQYKDSIYVPHKKT